MKEMEGMSKFIPGPWKFKDDIQFLKELQVELKTQEIDCQAAPRFWALEDFKWVITEEGYHDRASIYFVNESESMTTDDFVANVLSGEFDKEFTGEQIEELKNSHELGYDNEIFDWAQENYDRECYLVYEKEDSFIVPNTMFLTKAEAKRHIELNHYHYSPKVHTYAMTAWRAPKVERLLKILETLDWDSLCKI